MCATGANFAPGSCDLKKFRVNNLGALDQTVREIGTRPTDVPTHVLESLKAVSGGYPFKKGCKIYAADSASAFLIFDSSRYPQDPYGRHHNCQLKEFRQGLPVNQMCEEVPSELSDKYAHFDHVGGAAVVILQVWSHYSRIG